MTTYWVLWFLSLLSIFLGCMDPQMTFQACQIVANFTTDRALSIALADMNVMMQSSRLDMFAQMAFKTRKWETEFSTYFTVDMVTLWTLCWLLFALTNWPFVNGILIRLFSKDTMPTWISLHHWLLSKAIFPISRLLNCIRQNFTKFLNLFFGFDTFLFPSHISL